jgi:hypothetical protein
MAQTQIDHRGMKPVGRLTDYRELSAIVEAIFNKSAYADLPGGIRLRTKIMARGQCLAIDYNGLRYVEQNPTKRSPEAWRARQGAKIIWIIRPKDDAFLGKVEDGITYKKKGV